MHERQRLYLIDGYSNIFRAFYAIRNLSNSKGEPTNAVYGFLQMLRKLLRDENPELVGVALDVSSDTVRSQRYEEYKANRPPMPEDLVPQIPWIRKVLEAHRIPILELDRYEADDVLGTLSRKAAAAGYEVVLVSADKDLMQLVDDQVSFFHTGRSKLYDPAAVEEDFGVPPSQVVEVLALQGDASDNVPGVPGIGAKGAVQLVREFGTVEELLERADEVQRKSYRTGLTEHRDQALLSKELVTIHTDLDIPFEAESLVHEEPDTKALIELVRELEFMTLLRELEAAEGGGAESIEPAVAIEDPESWDAVAADLGRRLFLAVVGEPDAPGLAMGGPAGRVWLTELGEPRIAEKVRESLAGWLSDPAVEILGHDLKEVLRLSDEGPRTRARLVDTMLVSYVLRPSSRAHGLADLALVRLGYEASGPESTGEAAAQEQVPGTEGLLKRAGEAVELARRLAGPLWEELGDGPLRRVYEEIEAPLVPVLVGMEEKGVLLDTGFLEAMSAELGADLEVLEGEIYDLAGETFNINSPKQLGAILFEKLDYPVLGKTRKTKSYSTSADILEQLALQGYDLPEKILRYRELAKLKSTYVDALPAMVSADGRLHTRYEQAVAATGRLSSANPNLQNIPIRTKVGQRIRKAFRAPEGRRLLVADYNQIELRVLAHIAEEPVLRAGFEAGEDIHRSTAAAVFGTSPDLVNSEQRRAAKAINFGIIYGISPFGLARNLGIPQNEARRFIETYLERYPKVKAYMEGTLESAREAGKVETLYGRVRWLPDIQSKNRNLRENAGRMAINARIQGTAADLLKKAMIALDRRLRREHPEASLLLTVHDELVLEVPEAELEPVAALVREEMEGVEKLSVPLAVDVGWGRDWFEAKA